MKRRPFTFSDRYAIERMLEDGKAIKDIENDIKRPSSGIVKEIKKHTIYRFPSSFNGSIQCLNQNICKVKSKECYKYCKNVNFKLCPKLKKSPHVCNGCTSKGGCRFTKIYYYARNAHEEYKTTLSTSRNNLHYSEREQMILEEQLCPLIIKSKSVFHAVTTTNNAFGMNFIVKTIYWQIKNNRLPISSPDLPRTRKRVKKEQVDKSYKRDIKNHAFEDYEEYKTNNKNAIETKMDTVEGIKENDAPVLLTLEIVEINFLFIFKIESQTIDKVINMLLRFKNIIGDDNFDKIMEILLTDNGKEFNNVDLFTSTFVNINIFYCHPYSSYEKGSIENNHELIRRVIPKGVSLTPYTQEELNLLCSHINSLYREGLDGKCPFDLIDDYLPTSVLNEIGLSKINPTDVTLIPELLGDKNIQNIKKYLDKKDIEKANIKFINK